MTGETPVIGTLADLTATSVEHNSLAPREFMLVKMAALIPVDDRLSPISPMPGPPRRVGSPPMTSRVMIAVASVAGTARVVSAGGKILRAWAWRSLWLTPKWPSMARRAAAAGLTSGGASGSDPGRWAIACPVTPTGILSRWPGDAGAVAVLGRVGCAAPPGQRPDGRREAAAACGREL
jgi:hypothetical protein